jgi:IS1 family transposase
LQCDEQWSFVHKKQRHCDLQKQQDHQRGDCWDYVAFDPEHKLVLKVITGRRHAGQALALLAAVEPKLKAPPKKARAGGGLLLTTDGYRPYRPAVKRSLGHWPKGSVQYAVMQKHYDEQGRLRSIERSGVIGSRASLARALKASLVSRVVNTALIERHNASQRHRNSRKVRRSYRFSKDWATHQAMSALSQYGQNFCWCVRTLQSKRKINGRRRQRTPAMAAKLTDHVWSLREWLMKAVVGMTG